MMYIKYQTADRQRKGAEKNKINRRRWSNGWREKVNVTKSERWEVKTGGWIQCSQPVIFNIKQFYQSISGDSMLSNRIYQLFREGGCLCIFLISCCLCLIFHFLILSIIQPISPFGNVIWILLPWIVNFFGVHILLSLSISLFPPFFLLMFFKWKLILNYSK